MSKEKIKERILHIDSLFGKKAMTRTATKGTIRIVLNACCKKKFVIELIFILYYPLVNKNNKANKTDPKITSA